MSNTHSISSVASFDANPRCILPDAIIDPVSDEPAIEKLAGTVARSCRGHVHADDPARWTNSTLLACSIGIVRIAEGLGGALNRCGNRTAGANEIALELTRRDQ